MNPNAKPLEPPDLGPYHENRRRFPPEELLKYAGRYVAFNLDGTRIVASGRTEAEMEDQLRAAGIPPNQVVGSYVEALDEGPSA
jgi:hypothetical protein